MPTTRPGMLITYVISIMIKGKGETSKKRDASLKHDHHPAPNLTFIESVKGYLTNISYGFEGFRLSYFCGERGREGKKAKAFILGSEVESEASLAMHQEVVWLTYRKGIAITAKLHSDVGWGCLIRVAQMAWAHSLQRYFSLVHARVDRHYIITPFLEGCGHDFKYGLFRFLEMGNKLWQLKPGEWYTMTQAATTLEALHQNSPLKGSERLALKVYHETINVRHLLDLFGVSICSCPQRRANCFLCLNAKRTHSFQKSLKAPENKHVVLIITTKLGKRSVGKQNYGALLELMSLPIFNGCLGGTPDKARFLTGRIQEQISYLDPHYVETAVDQLSLAKRMEVFRCREVRYMGREDLHPELALCFYLTSPGDLQALLEAIDRTRLEEPFLRYDWESSDEFEVLQEEERTRPKLQEKFEDLEESMSEANRSSINSSFLME